jgi:hypothetical protein
MLCGVAAWARAGVRVDLPRPSGRAARRCSLRHSEDDHSAGRRVDPRKNVVPDPGALVQADRDAEGALVGVMKQVAGDVEDRASGEQTWTRTGVKHLDSSADRGSVERKIGKAHRQRGIWGGCCCRGSRCVTRSLGLSCRLQRER